MNVKTTQTIVIRGCCRLSVIRGAISIDCATLTPSSNPVTLLLPSTHALPVMRAVRSSASKEAQPYHHQEGKASPGLEQPIVISLQNVQSGIESIESVCRLAGMPIPSGGMWQPSNRWSSASEESKDTYKVLLEPERDHCGTVIPHNWIEALESGASSSSSDSGERAYIVQGPKGVGKSTFAKLLVNTLLSQ